jgi:dGTPase
MTYPPVKRKIAKIWEERRSAKAAKRPRDVREPFERDRARIVHSAAFRRLQAKTQVLGIGEGDFHRTRLTHSMEAAQIGRGICMHLDRRVKGAHSPYVPPRCLIESICLAHDLGHPPFAHGGEAALNLMMREHGGFEGNAQTLRLLARHEALVTDFGLDLTRRVLLGILKYPAPYRRVVRTQQPRPGDVHTEKRNNWKPPKCYYDSDEDIVNWVIERLVPTDKTRIRSLQSRPKKDEHGKTRYKSFDTSIMEIADDIAYGVHDLEDCVALKLIGIDIWDRVKGELDAVWARREGISRLKRILFSDDSTNRRRAIGALVNAFITSTEIVENRFDEPILKYNAILCPPAKRFLDALMKLVATEVINSPEVQTLEYRGQQIVIRIFDALNSDPQRLLKDGFRRQWEAAQSEAEKRRVVCDYIAGMTDEYATRLYERLYVPRQGTVFSRL